MMQKDNPVNDSDEKVQLIILSLKVSNSVRVFNCSHGGRGSIMNGRYKLFSKIIK